MKRPFRRLLALFHSRRIDDDLDREVASHLAHAEEEYRRRGMTDDDARRAARRAMGSVALAKGSASRRAIVRVARRCSA
jgi:hypothetical protein